MKRSGKDSQEMKFCEEAILRHTRLVCMMIEGTMQRKNSRSKDWSTEIWDVEGMMRSSRGKLPQTNLQTDDRKEQKPTQATTVSKYC